MGDIDPPGRLDDYVTVTFEIRDNGTDDFVDVTDADVEFVVLHRDTGEVLAEFTPPDGVNVSDAERGVIRVHLPFLDEGFDGPHRYEVRVTPPDETYPVVVAEGPIYCRTFLPDDADESAILLHEAAGDDLLVSDEPTVEGHDWELKGGAFKDSTATEGWGLSLWQCRRCGLAASSALTARNEARSATVAEPDVERECDADVQ